MAKIDTDKVIKSFGNGWVVTEYGIENQNTYYPIESKRLWEGGDGPGGWEAHMDEKRWVNVTEFAAALAFAREHFKKLRRTVKE